MYIQYIHTCIDTCNASGRSGNSTHDHIKFNNSNLSVELKMEDPLYK